MRVGGNFGGGTPDGHCRLRANCDAADGVRFDIARVRMAARALKSIGSPVAAVQDDEEKKRPRNSPNCHGTVFFVIDILHNLIQTLLQSGTMLSAI